MKEKKNAILLGDYANYQYHALKNVDQELKAIFEEELDIVCTEDYELLSTGLLQYDLCICYADYWDKEITKKQMAGLLSFVGSGGGLLVIHNGISLQNRYEFAQMIGAKFIQHPPCRKLTFQVAASDHPIMKGIPGFELEEEPYQFVFDNFTDKTILLEYKYEDAVYPAAWAQEFGEGRIVYLMPGHDTKPFKDSTYRKIISNSEKWILKST